MLTVIVLLPESGSRRAWTPFEKVYSVIPASVVPLTTPCGNTWPASIVVNALTRPMRVNRRGRKRRGMMHSLISLMLHSGRSESTIDRRPTAVRKQDRARDVAGGVGGEKQRWSDHFLGTRPSLQRALVRVCALPIDVRGDLCRQRGLHDAGSNGVDTHTKWSELRGGSADELYDPGLGHGIDRLSRLDDLRSNRREDHDAAAASGRHD